MKNRIMCIFAAALTLFSLVDVYAQNLQKNPKIAVMDFINVSGRAKYDYLQRSISENIITTFAESRNVILVERARLRSALNELKLGLTGLVDESTAAKVGSALGADGIIVGSYTILGDQLRINARLIDVQTIQAVFAKQVSGTNLVSLIDEISDILLIEITPNQFEKAELLRKGSIREKQLQSRFKNPGIAAVGSLLIPIAGHAYAGGNANIMRGVIYTGVGTSLLTIGIISGLGDDGLIPFLIGAGIHLASAVDAGISANRNNNKIRTEGLRLGLNPDPENKSYYLSLSYTF